MYVYLLASDRTTIFRLRIRIAIKGFKAAIKEVQRGHVVGLEVFDACLNGHNVNIRQGQDML